jgi:DNA replication and repair protein RecF
MGLQSLEVSDFRNIRQTSLRFSPGLNLVCGDNAAGKTSLLEAIYCLGRVRSFRTHSAEQPIRYGQSAFQLVGRVGVPPVTIGIERQSSTLKVHLAGEPIRRLSDLAGSFPVQVLSADTPTVLNGGPRYRRQTMDWALFHVEGGYREVWQRYTRVLRQRNAALRARAPANQVQAWDIEILEAATKIDHYRCNYFRDLGPNLEAAMDNLLPGLECELRYQPGWSANVPLTEVLAKALEKDRLHGYTRYGPHRADFKLIAQGHDVKAYCSRGQQKAIVVGLMLAQVALQQQRDAPMGAFLLDDLASELDSNHQARVLDALRHLHTQVFVTAIEGNAIDITDWQDACRFHVEQGVFHAETGVTGNHN